MTNVSRRSIAKGAAWSVPAVAVASSAPAVATSATVVDISCGEVPPFGNNGAPGISGVYVGDGTYSGGTAYSVSMGQLNLPTGTSTNPFAYRYVDAAGQPHDMTGYYLLPGAGSCDCSSPQMVKNITVVRNSDGAAYHGKVTAYTPTGCSPVVPGTALAQSQTVQTDLPYNADLTKDSIKSITVPFKFVPLNGTTPLGCCSYNFTMTPKVGALGYQQAGTNGWSVTL